MAYVIAHVLALALTAHPPVSNASIGADKTARADTGATQAAPVKENKKKFITGHVIDASTHEPIAGALVQQEGSVNSVFSKPDGSFHLPIESAAPRNLTIAAVGFETNTVALNEAQDLEVRLIGVDTYVPSSPITQQVSVGQSAAETAPLNTGLMFGYSLRHVESEAPGFNGKNGSITGLSNNDFRLGVRMRWMPWLAEAEGFHTEVPVDVAGLRKEDNPAFKPSTWQAGTRFGPIWQILPDLETAWMGAYRWSNTVPNNGRTPYTGTDIDFEQTRHALGGVLLTAWRPGRGQWQLEASAGYYPWVFANADSPGRPYASSNLLDTRTMLSYELMPGLRIGLGAGYERWAGPGEDDSMRISTGIHYTPGGVPKGNE